MSSIDPDNILFAPTTPPLRLAPSPATDDHRAVLEVLRRVTASARGHLERGVRFLSRFPLLVRATDWLTAARTWLAPATAVVARSGVALPVWLATTLLVQRVVVTVARRISQATRVGLIASARIAQRGLSLTGQWGKDRAARVSRAVERLDKSMTTFARKATTWAGALSANRSHIRVLRDVSLVVVVARQFRALVPPQWRLVVTGLSLLTLGGHTRRWITRTLTTTKALLGELANAFITPQTIVAAMPTGTVPIRPVPQPPRRPHHHR